MTNLPQGILSLGNNKGGHVRAYFLVDDGILIDTLSEDSGETLFSQLAAHGIGPEDIHHVLHTHGHDSHVGGAMIVQQLSKARLYASSWEAGIIENQWKAEKVRFPLPWRDRPLHPVVFALQAGLAAGLGKHKTCVIDQPLKNGDRVGPLIVVATPGHSRGHLAFWHPELKVLFAGDHLTTWPGKTPQPWTGFTVDQAAWDRSTGVLADLPAEWLCTGHGDLIEGAQEILKGMVR